MKNKLTLLAILLQLSYVAFAQAPPEGINYQAIARDASGNPLINQVVDVQFTIHQSSGTGTIVFQEVHSTTTNPFGLINLVIGSVNTVGFPMINWGLGTYFLQVEINDGAGFQDLGATQLLSVPYALHAKTATSGVPGADGYNSLIDTLAAGSSCPNGGYQVLIGLDSNANGTLESIEISKTFVICNGIDGTSGTTYFTGNGISLSGDTITNLGDADADPSNELQDLSLTGNSLSLTNDPTPVDLTPYLDNTDAQTLSINANTLAISNGNSVTLPTAPTYTAGTGINLTGNVITNTAPDQTVVLNNGTGINVTGTYPNFTINNTSPASGINITGGGITSVSGTSPSFTISTPAQTLTYTAPNLTLSNGGGTVTIPPSPWGKTGSTIHELTAGDNVGIGTTNTSNKLQIHTTTNGIKNLQLTSTSTGATNTDGFEISNDGSTALNMWQKENDDWNFNISSSGSTAISIKPNTNVGIGTLTAMNRLTVAGGASIGGGYVGNGAPANGLLVEGNVGIGTTSPLVKFHVEENASAVMLLKEVTPTNGAAFVMESLNQYVLLSNESGTFRIENGTTSLQPFNINSTGEVGIGGSAFYSALDVYGKITMRNGATTGYIPVSDANGTMTWTDPNSVISITPSPWTLNGTDIHPVSITNNVGIGTNVPNAQLEVTRGVLGDIQLFPISNTTNPLVINAGGSGGKYFQFNHPNGISMNFGSNGTTGWMGTNSNHDLSIVTNNSIVGTFTTTGNLGIGTTSPNINGATKSITIAASNNYVANRIASLELQGSHNGPNVDIGRVDFNSIGGSINNHARISSVNGGGTIGTSGRLLFHTSNGGVLTEKVRITETGNVGIGTTTPSQKLDVNGTINISSNTGEVNNSAKTGAANLVPIAYGNVTALGNINTGTGNFTISNTATGAYLITVAGEVLDVSNCIIQVTTQNSNPRFIGYGSSGGSLYVYIRDNTSAFVNNNFSFIIYRP